MKTRAYAIVPLIVQSIVWLPTYLVLLLFCHLKVTGKENLRGLKQAIFAANHSNELDGIFVTAALNPLGSMIPIFYVTGTFVSFANDLFGWRKYFYSSSFFFKLLGGYPHIPGFRSYGKSLQHHVSILKDGYSVCIFPEGMMTKDGNLSAAHGGIGYLACVTGVPIIPVYISGAYKLGPAAFFSRSHYVTVVVGKPFFVKEITNPDSLNHEYYKPIANSIMTNISELQKTI